MKNNYHFLGIIEHGDVTMGLYFPDLEGCVTGGETVNEIITNASDVLKLHLHGMEQDNEIIPEPRAITEISLKKNEIPIIVNADMRAFRENIDNEYVEQVVTIPSWVNNIVQEKGINLSEALQSAIMQQIK